MRYAGESIDSPSDLAWGGGLENYGADRIVGDYLLNRDGTFDCGEISDPGDIEAFEVFGKASIIRKQQGKEQRAFKQFRGQNERGKAENRISENETEFSKIGRPGTKFG